MFSSNSRKKHLSGLSDDGAELVDKAFSINDPILAINTLETKTERSEQKEFSRNFL